MQYLGKESFYFKLYIVALNFNKKAIVVLNTFRYFQLFLCGTLLFTANSCKENDTPEPESSFVSEFYSNTTDLEFIVGYEEGAEPYIEYNGNTAWEVMKSNIQDLLSGRNLNMIVPTALDDMVSLGVLEQMNYTDANLRSFAADIQKHTNLGPQKGIVLLFLDGYYIKDGQPNNRILGVNLNGTGILALFKPVIESASQSAAQRTLVEQSTLTHELGHALGLVNNGVRATTAHHDEANGAHCTNESCVMYWKNGAGEITQFIVPFLQGGDIKLFGDACIADVQTK